MTLTSAQTDYREQVQRLLGVRASWVLDRAVRVVLIAIAGAFLSIYFDSVTLLIWAGLIISLDISFHFQGQWWLKRKNVPKRAYFAMLSHYALAVITMCLMPICLAVQGTLELLFAAGTLLFGLAIQALVNIPFGRGFSIINAVAFGLTSAVITAFLYFTAEDMLTMILVLLAGSGIIALYLFTVFVMLKRDAEAKINRAALSHVQKMEAVGRLSNGIAHDFNNLLTVILGNLDLMRETQGTREKEMLETEAREAASRGAALVRQLLAISRRTSLERSLVQLNPYLLSFETMARRLLPSNIALSVDGASREDLAILVDRAQLDSALLNLVINARDAMETTGGKLCVKATERRPGANAPEFLYPGSLNEAFVCIEVRDTGEGIPAEILDEITDPYVTTKPEGKGSGMGLAMVKGFAEQSGGGLSIESVEGQGTSVYVYLPV